MSIPEPEIVKLSEVEPELIIESEPERKRPEVNIPPSPEGVIVRSTNPEKVEKQAKAEEDAEMALEDAKQQYEVNIQAELVASIDADELFVYSEKELEGLSNKQLGKVLARASKYANLPVPTVKTKAETKAAILEMQTKIPE